MFSKVIRHLEPLEDFHLSGLSRTYGQANPHEQGFSLIELIVVIAIFASLAAIAVPSYRAYINKAKIVRAIADTKEIAITIDVYRMEHDSLPHTLAEVHYAAHLDPWGNPYQYVNLEAEGEANARKDQSMTALNSDYDLYSMGKDGQSDLQITTAMSRDDILRATNGSYFGLAALY